MTLEKIKRNAPDGATHYTQENYDQSIFSYWRIHNGYLESWSYDDDCWLTYEHVTSFHKYVTNIWKKL